MQVSIKAHCPCGEVQQGDIVLAIAPEDALIVGMVKKFLALPDQHLFAEVDKYKPAPGTAEAVDTWLVDSPVSVFIDLARVRSNLTWAKRGNGRIKVLVPTALPWMIEPRFD